jgi:hypothetical protein
MVLDSLAKYAGPNLPARVRGLLEDLEHAGFTLVPSGRSKKTIQVQWEEAYVAYLNEFVLRHRGVLGYRFLAPPYGPRNACPPSFSKEVFCREHDCSAADIDIQPNAGELYLHILEPRMAIRLVKRAVDSELGVRESESSIAMDIEAIERDDTVSDTTREALVQARLGQGAFRKQLMRRFDNACAVTGLAVSRLLRASHVKPWRHASNAERLDPDNGLLLSANLDALFDAVLITFDGEGSLHISRRLRKDQQQLLGPIGDLRAKPTTEQSRYLKFHAELFRRWET